MVLRWLVTASQRESALKATWRTCAGVAPRSSVYMCRATSRRSALCGDCVAADRAKGNQPWCGRRCQAGACRRCCTSRLLRAVSMSRGDGLRAEVEDVELLALGVGDKEHHAAGTECQIRDGAVVERAEVGHCDRAVHKRANTSAHTCAARARNVDNLDKANLLCWCLHAISTRLSRFTVADRGGW